MTRKRNDRGSALLLVVGLLAIIAMLGSTFVVVASLDARQSRSLANKSQAEPVARGIVTQLGAILCADLWIDDAKDVYGSATKWHHFIDYEGLDSTGEAVDKHLSSMWPSGGTWAHLTNLANVASGSVTNVSTSSTTLADTDGEGTGDARLFDSGVTNDDGDEYYAAVRLIDLSALWNLNAAGATSPVLDPSRPSNVDLWGGLKAAQSYFLLSILGRGSVVDGNLEWLYNGLHAGVTGPVVYGRCGTAATDLTNFAHKSARRVLSPDQDAGDYKPFAIGDEMFLRYYASGAPTETGRLYEWM